MEFTRPMEPATTFGTYRLLEPLGEGGMGRVWKALDLHLERMVALKLLKVVDANQRTILLAEAKTACQLHHPHIAVIYEAGEVDGEPYIAMEFAEGETLRARLRQPQPEPFLRKILTQAASALAHAHQKGIIHRDIKPDNLMVTTRGDLKLLDFGVAKRSLPSLEKTRSDGFTITGETLQGFSQGTPGYMSPEQANGWSIGPATDQFSLGLSLFELATGFHPFRTPTLLGTLHAITHERAPDLAMERKDLSPQLVKILNRMVEKRVEDRFPSMEALLEALSGLSPDFNPASPHRSSKTGRGVSAWLKAGAAALVLLGLPLTWWWLRKDPDAGVFPARGGRRAVAILPLEMQGIPSDKRWLGDSFQDAMAMGLLRRGDLLVLDRTRVAESLAEASAGKLIPGPSQVSSVLGADLLLMGTLQAVGDRLRLTLRLIRGQKGEVLDQILFEGKLADSLPFEDDLGRRVPALFGLASGAAATGGNQARMVRTRECYIRGLELVENASAQTTKEAAVAFEEAVRSEPGYAPAHAGLAWALGGFHAQEVHLGKDQTKALLDQSLQEARKAVELDSRLPMAHRILGQLLDRLGDHAGARVALQKAVELDPADYRALASLADSYAYLDDPDSRAQARSHFKQALDLHPRYWWANYRLAVLLLNEGDLKAAVFHADRARQLEPSADYAHLVSGLSLLWSGDLPDADQRLDDGLRQVPSSGLLQLTKALCDYTRGDPAAFRIHTRAFSGSWSEPHPIGVLLRGLNDGSAGRTLAMRDRFQAFAEKNRSRDLSSVPTSERRVISVNAYHMARALAQGGQSAAARSLLDLAEKMQPGKVKVASQDPLLMKHVQ
jgi:tetratricopeptide (TPR) repeat protein/TolB-like protein